DAAGLCEALPGPLGARLREAGPRLPEPVCRRRGLCYRGLPVAQGRGAGGGQAMSRWVVVNGQTYLNLVEGTFENGVGAWVQGSAQSPVSVTTAQKRRG